MNEPRYVVIANPDGKRWLLYQQELLAHWQRRHLTPHVALIPWRDAIARLGNLDDLLTDDHPALFRLESPGRDLEVARLLLAAGDDAERPECDWRRATFAKSALVRPGLMFEGFRRTLHGLRAFLDRRPSLQPTACPLAIAELFDKTATAHRLEAAGLPTPRRLNPPGDARRLLRMLRGDALTPDPSPRRRGEQAAPMATAYVKLNTGSSATGIAVVRALDDPASAITSMVRIGDQFHNTRKLQRITGDALYPALDFLLREGAIVQEGIAHAQIDGQNFDVRVVVLHGTPAFTIFRLSGLPMTNLHLGGRRGDWGTCRAAIPTRAWLDALDHCILAARLYDCAVVGIDLVFERGFARHFILEINAFGDFFPGLTDDFGRSVHAREIDAAAAIRS